MYKTLNIKYHYKISHMIMPELTTNNLNLRNIKKIKKYVFYNK